VGSNEDQSRRSQASRSKREKKKEKKRERDERKGNGERRRRGKKPRKENTIEMKRLAEKWEIWNEEEKVVKLEAEARRLVPEHFYKWI